MLWSGLRSAVIYNSVYQGPSLTTPKDQLLQARAPSSQADSLCQLKALHPADCQVKSTCFSSIFSLPPRNSIGSSIPSKPFFLPVEWSSSVVSAHPNLHCRIGIMISLFSLPVKQLRGREILKHGRQSASEESLPLGRER